MYNVIWADDEIDDLCDNDAQEIMRCQGISIVKKAHDAMELEAALADSGSYDAVIVDANFNKRTANVENERDVSGLSHAISILEQKQDTLPMYLYTARTSELLQEEMRADLDFLKNLRSKNRWFSKIDTDGFMQMLEQIRADVDSLNTTAHRVNSQYKEELNAAFLVDAKDYLFDFLCREQEETLQDMREPFIPVRRAIERMFSLCEKLQLIPPVSDNTNGTAAYLLQGEYRIDGKLLYRRIGDSIIPMPVASSLRYITTLTQDEAHSKVGLKLDVHKYWEETKDTHLLRSVVFVLMDVLKWFGITAIHNQDLELNATRWEKMEETDTI